MSTLLTMDRHQEAMAALKRRGNPFRQQFARNSDDPMCTFYHVDSLFARERAVIRALVESYRGAADRPTAVLPVLAPRGAGKTHLLHWLKHGPFVESASTQESSSSAEQVASNQLFVTPGTFRIDAGGAESSFLEYVLYQFINVLLASSEQRGGRPLVFLSEQLTRSLLLSLIDTSDVARRYQAAVSSTPRKSLWPWTFRTYANRWEELRVLLSHTADACRVSARQADLDPEALFQLVSSSLESREARDLKGEFRKRILLGFVRGALLDEENDLADFLTDEFADPPFSVKPTRSQLTLSLLQALTEVIVGSGIPVAVAFDQLEELLYGQTEDQVRRASDAFFGGLVQLMSQCPGLAILLFVEEGLWNRIVPPLSPHILDRIHEPLYLPEFGSIRQVRLATPKVDQLVEVVRMRVHKTLGDSHLARDLPSEFPFSRQFLEQLASREGVLRLMLQGCCSRLDEDFDNPAESCASISEPTWGASRNQSGAAEPVSAPAFERLCERWRLEVMQSHKKIQSVGALSGASADLIGGLVRWLLTCAELGVEQDDWRMTTVNGQVSVGEHPTYGTLTLVEWTNQSGRRFNVAIGLWLGRGVGKPRDLETKLSIFESENGAPDHLILVRPDDDARLSGRTQTLWLAAEQAGRSLRLEVVDSDVFAKLHAFPTWIKQVVDELGGGKIPEEIFIFLAKETEVIMRKLGLPVTPGKNELAA